MDADVDALSETKQGQLGRLLSRTGGDGRQTYAELTAVDSDAADALLEIDDFTTQHRFIRAYQDGTLDTDDLSTVVKRYNDLDPDEKALARRSIARSGDDGVRLLEISVCNSPCDSLLKSVDDFGDSRGLTSKEKNKLVDAFEDSDDVPDDVPGEDPEAVYQDLEFLDSENVDDLNGAIGEISGDRSGYTGLAGETRTARKVIENDANADIELRKKVDPNDIEDDDIPDGLTRDDDLKKGPTDIDVNDKNGPAYESKNTRDFKPLYSGESAHRSVGNNLESLRKKLNTLAASGEDEIVVVMRKDQLNAEYSDEIRDDFRPEVDDSVKELDNPTQLAGVIEEDFDGVTVEFKSYEEVGA